MPPMCSLVRAPEDRAFANAAPPAAALSSALSWLPRPKRRNQRTKQAGEEKIFIADIADYRTRKKWGWVEAGTRAAGVLPPTI